MFPTPQPPTSLLLICAGVTDRAGAEAGDAFGFRLPASCRERGLLLVAHLFMNLTRSFAPPDSSALVLRTLPCSASRLSGTALGQAGELPLLQVTAMAAPLA